MRNSDADRAPVIEDRSDPRSVEQQSTDPYALRVRDLRIESRIGGKVRPIVTGLDLDLRRGEAVAIVGESGSGKSITAKALVGLLPSGVRAHGSILYGGRNLVGMRERELRGIRGRDITLMFQDPYTLLNPLQRCGAHIAETLRVAEHRGTSRVQRQLEVERRLHEVEITDKRVSGRYPFELSGGMRQRVGLAAALAGDPQILIADEPSTALDVSTQKEILRLLRSLQLSRGMSLILITHNLRVAFALCDRIYVMYAGTILEVGKAREVETEPFHPYTLGLLTSEPSIDVRQKVLTAIPGFVPYPSDVAGQCAFAPRCRWVDHGCTEARPMVNWITPTRASSCVRLSVIRPELAATRRVDVQWLDSQPQTSEDRPLLKVDGLGKVFSPRSGNSVMALHDVSLTLRAHQSVGLVGESGSGKTTLARCLVGLERPTSGTIVIDGINANDYAVLSNHDRRRLRRTMQMVFQDPYSTLNPSMTVGETLREALALRQPPVSNREHTVSSLLEQVGLHTQYVHRKPQALSGGERQRVAIARALAVNPRILVCDEPVSALDVSVQAQILNLLATLRKEVGVAYLFITHDLAVVRQAADYVYVLSRGEVVESGPVDQVLNEPQHPYTRQLMAAVPRSDPGWLAASASGSLFR
jgi:peptide/nickel transport system ATP-binding protein